MIVKKLCGVGILIIQYVIHQCCAFGSVLRMLSSIKEFMRAKYSIKTKKLPLHIVKRLKAKLMYCAESEKDGEPRNQVPEEGCDYIILNFFAI